MAITGLDFFLGVETIGSSSSDCSSINSSRALSTGISCTGEGTLLIRACLAISKSLLRSIAVKAVFH